jgi:hypothetical protein
MIKSVHLAGELELRSTWWWTISSFLVSFLQFQFDAVLVCYIRTVQCSGKVVRLSIFLLCWVRRCCGRRCAWVPLCDSLQRWPRDSLRLLMTTCIAAAADHCRRILLLQVVRTACPPFWPCINCILQVVPCHGPDMFKEILPSTVWYRYQLSTLYSTVTSFTDRFIIIDTDRFRKWCMRPA